MDTGYLWSTVDSTGHTAPQLHPGDLVTTVTGYPILYEVLCVETSGLLRVRGIQWAPGYSALVARQDVRPSTRLLSD